MPHRTTRSRIGHLALLAGTTGLLVAGLGLPSASHAAGKTHAHATPSTHQDWIVVSVAGSTAPTSMVVERSADSPEVTVAISATTTLVRRFNGKSDPSELSAGDHVQITSAPADSSTTASTSALPTTIDATAIKDETIQVGYSQINGRVVFIGRDLSRMVVEVTANEGMNAALQLHTHATVDTTAATPVDLLGKAMGTVADVRPGMVLTLYGLTNREGHIVLAPHDITQLLATSATALTKAAPSDSTPK